MLSVKEMKDLVKDLEMAGCQFWACEGPTAPIKDMITCRTCFWIITLRKRLKRED